MNTSSQPACTTTQQATSVKLKPSRVNQIIVFDSLGYYRLYDSWPEAAAALNLKKHEFYFALNHGTSVAKSDDARYHGHLDGLFVDVYVSTAERARIRKADATRNSMKAAAARKEVSEP